MQRTILTYFLIGSGLFTKAQTEISIQDSKGAPISGATVWLQGLSDSGKTAFEISDQNGLVRTKLSKPLILSVNHMGFETLADTLSPGSSSVLQLVESKQQLNEVVVTGQFQPQSAKNSVYKVRTIGQERIQNQAAVSLDQVLANELNIRFSRDNATGTSGLSLQGLSGQYVKVLVDGVPMTGRSGVSNEIDLAQLDVQNIQRIELIEGPMSVNYGADALAGVINIITKKDITTKFEGTVILQEETVGSEYSLLDQGIHSPSINLGYQINENWYTQLNGRLNSFGGWKGSAEGRQSEWYPKTQYFGGGMVRFSNEKFEAYYRADYLHEKLENLGQANIYANPPRAIDEEYLADRWVHQLQTDVTLAKATLSSAISFTDYERRTRRFTKNLLTGEETLTSGEGDQDTIFYKTFFIRETLNNALSGSWGSLQLGLDGTLETAGGSTLSDGNKHLNDFGVFTSAELLLGKLKIRPGIRITKNSVFKTTPAPSINFNYLINRTTQLRWSYGRGFRAPSIRELYHEFVDTNHNILGNSNLKPEYSHSANLDITKQLEKQHLEVSIGGFYNHIDNRITYFIPAAANQPTSYVNLTVFKTTGTNASISYSQNNLSMATGFSYIGQYQSLSESEDVSEFIFSPEINNQVRYEFSKIGLRLSTFYKFTGPRKQYTLDENEDVQLSKIQGYHFLDATLAKQFSSLQISIGARNILDVTNINSTYSGGAHSSGGSRSVSYGRSYFLQLKYQFKYK